MYSKHDVAFILYNNRSVNGAVSNFLPKYKLSAERLSEMENMMSFCNSLYQTERTVEVNSGELDLLAPDILVTPESVGACTTAIYDSHVALIAGGPEMEWLLSRGIDMSMAVDMRLGSLNHIVAYNPETLEPLGVTIHPMLRNILSDDVSDGGILIPLFSGNKLVNCTTRRISDVGKLKYTQACPDLDVWGLDGAGEYWIGEGLFDAAAIRSTGMKAASVSSAMWSVPQLIQLMDLAESINIFVDNDRVGLRSAAVIQRFLGMNGIPCKTWISQGAKDAAEHFLEKKLGWDSVVEIHITRDMVRDAPDMTFNFTKYLKNRNF